MGEHVDEELAKELREFYPAEKKATGALLRVMREFVVATVDRHLTELDANEATKTAARKRRPREEKKEKVLEEEPTPSPPAKKQKEEEWKCAGNILTGTPCPANSEKHREFAGKTRIKGGNPVDSCKACKADIQKEKRALKKTD